MRRSVVAFGWRLGEWITATCCGFLELLLLHFYPVFFCFCAFESKRVGVCVWVGVWHFFVV